MAVTTVETNNKLIKFTRQINREYVKQNMYSPYMGEDINSIIRIRHELKEGGEQINIPMVTRLKSPGVSTGTLVGNEEKIDNYGMRVWVDWARNAVVSNKAQGQKSSADIFGEAKPLLSDWGKELQRDEITAGLMALPSTSEPVGLNTDPGQRVNGVLYEAATAAQRNTWNADNVDRVLYGKLISNYNATHATALANVDSTDDKLSRAVGRLAKARMKLADPKIRPYQTVDGYEHYLAFAGSNAFRDLKADLETINKDARPRENGDHKKNPIFMDGDLLDDGIIYREVPEISQYVTNVWTTLKTAGATSSRVEPVFFCGQQAATVAWAQMAKPTRRAEDDYEFVTGVGIEMAYGIAKMFKKHPMTASTLVQWGVLTAFVSAAVDA